MPFTQIIVPAASLQPFENESTAFNVSAMLPNWGEMQRLELHEDSLCMPFEMAYARALGMPSDEGKMPWAAFETQALGAPCAWVHPCHLDVGMTDMVMQPVDRLRLTDAESRELHALIAPYFEQDGITLKYHSAARWLAIGSQFADFECASLSRVQGRSINDFLPDAGEFPQQLKISRLQAEMQMLLYTHPISEARQARGLPTVNSFWVDGAGVLEALPEQTSDVRLELRLQEAQHSESAYLSAWRSLTAEWAKIEQATTITLCGELAAITLEPQKPGFLQQFISKFSRLPARNLRGVL
ncbi:phosphoglycerate mutase [Variovorax sp. PCZ-1]|uniref:phosphoglycerate mutase n=1 Tax=Variovorax sp. PCZ-1 TaxID=2835533 RepID=UPI001BD12518|nr:phosphoglycerate mutase [Variovorax sp. PCZ-1]MBS7807135.1 phosphoglycerate mutase [Variovorax sp. PCZ-1]